MSAWGCVGKVGSAYMRHLNIPLAKRMMKAGSALPGAEGGMYGKATAFNKWSRGYVDSGKSTWKDVAARKGTIYGLTAGAGAIGGGILHGAMSRRKKSRLNAMSAGSY